MTAAVHIVFDTLKFVETLKKAGLEDKQAKALLKVQKEVLGEVFTGELATKHDVAALKQDVAALKQDVAHLEKRLDKVEVDLKLLKWMMSFVIAGVGALIFKAFFS